MFEDPEWRAYFWTALPSDSAASNQIPMASILMTVLSDLLFCPDLTVAPLPNAAKTVRFLIKEIKLSVFRNPLAKS